MLILKTPQECFKYRKKLLGTLGLVPTMGALHEGHLSLIKKSQGLCANTIVSIFINPNQFGPDEDLKQYPSSVNQDLDTLKSLGVGCVFLPETKSVYKTNHSIYVFENCLARVLEGASRPDFFQGVLTVVVKLFNLFKPTHTFFGQKDAQQLLIIQKLIQDMNYNIQLIKMPTVREKGGLALSSRNHYLSLEQKKVASNIYRALLLVRDAMDNKERSVAVLSGLFHAHIGLFESLRVDYFCFSNLTSLKEVTSKADCDVLISAAVFCGDVRLIDNIIYTI